MLVERSVAHSVAAWAAEKADRMDHYSAASSVAKSAANWVALTAVQTAVLKAATMVAPRAV